MIVNGWQRPSRKFCESAHCVEAKAADGHVFIRASVMAPDVVTLTGAEFAAFVGAVKAGEYDHMIDSL